MNLERFIAKRLIGSKSYKSSISAPIIKIAIVAIAVGVIMMLIAFATGLGLQNKIRDKISAFNGHITISNFDNNNAKVSLKPISKNQDFYPEFKSVNGITHIQGVAFKAGVIRTEDDFEGVVIKGLDTDYNWDVFKDYVVQGRLPNYKESLNDEVLISEYMSNRLNIKLGDKAVTYFLRDNTLERPLLRAFKVVGTYNSGFQEFDETYVIGDIRHIRRLNKWNDDDVGHFEVFIDDFSELEQKGVEVYENIDSTLDSKTIKQQYYSIFEWLGLFDFNIALIIGIMILIAGMNMAQALLVLILERTQMIGILKALGSNDNSIRKIFLYNASYLIVVGLFWGNLIGLGLLFVQKYFKVLPLNPETYYVTEAPVYIGWYILFVNLGTLILCLLMLLIPSYVISKINPIKAIKFD